MVRRAYRNFNYQETTTNESDKENGRYLGVNRLGKFPVPYLNTNREKPMYELNKSYSATQINDEARARLIMRWNDLEKRKQKRPRTHLEVSEMALLIENETLNSITRE
jgi:hypothetical protein